MEEAAVLADRVAIMDHGSIIAQGTPQQLIREVCGEQILMFALSPMGPEVAARMADALPY
jgi:ABC-2 type transport system ATP-binding protein